MTGSTSSGRSPASPTGFAKSSSSTTCKAIPTRKSATCSASSPARPRANCPAPVARCGERSSHQESLLEPAHRRSPARPRARGRGPAATQGTYHAVAVGPGAVTRRNTGSAQALAEGGRDGRCDPALRNRGRDRPPLGHTGRGRPSELHPALVRRTRFPSRPVSGSGRGGIQCLGGQPAGGRRRGPGAGAGPHRTPAPQHARRRARRISGRSETARDDRRVLHYAGDGRGGGGVDRAHSPAPAARRLDRPATDQTDVVTSGYNARPRWASRRSRYRRESLSVAPLYNTTTYSPRKNRCSSLTFSRFTMVERWMRTKRALSSSSSSVFIVSRIRYHVLPACTRT